MELEFTKKLIHWKQKTTEQSQLHQLLEKIFARLLLQQMLEHVEKYEIINKIQFGFLKRKSNVSYIVDKISEQFVGKMKLLLVYF